MAVAIGIGLALPSLSIAQAVEPPWAYSHHIHLFHHKDEGTPPPGTPRFIPHTDHRAGHPRNLAHHLERSATAGGIGSYIGGGVCLGLGDPRFHGEGTWGWDETGSHLFRRRALLGWSHGRKYQGGTGAYYTDAPHIPDPVFGLTYVFDRVRSGED
jgi:hypothetical protein